MNRGQTRNENHKDKARLAQTPDRGIDNNDIESNYAQEPGDIAAVNTESKEVEEMNQSNQRPD
ncbi:hypothetical protein [Alteribacillus bidgolensis]|uniref:DUF4025 domain-containing protein n=1 Tax=Alteribacillus bidgolensis TaxID=930129 RepID=A0A1G8RIB0_9BACI|nr:hypothetical protein [Alteribacillus bidgolensis]SDJ16718.1 hypothetical protein SAMN05216352_1282 [Alteribacillus bidgolensis]